MAEHDRREQEKITLKYVWQDHCSFCTFFKPTFDKIVKNNGWEGEEVSVPEIAEFLNEIGVSKTPAILVYNNGEYKGFIEGVKRASVISETIKRMAS